MRTYLSWLAAVAIVVTSSNMFRAADAPKHTTKQVMKEANNNKDGLLTKVKSGKATTEDKEKLLALYIDLSLNKPKKGDLDSWKEKTDKIVAAAKDSVAGKAGADKALIAAVSCMGCHKAHR